MIGCRRRVGYLQQIVITVIFCSTPLFACAPIQGYPKDPENTDATLTALQPYFDGTVEQKYIAAQDDNTRTQIRNQIILARMRGYDIEFSNFERTLYGQGNTITVGSDLIGLVLGGLTATTGNATTKAALGAASTGIIGANAAINKDLYYQKTIPALLTQMEADRLKAKLPIVQGMTQPDSKYPLMQAYIDLDAYKNAGSIPGAISSVTQSAANDKEVAQSNVVTISGITLGGPAVLTRYSKLSTYLQQRVVANDTNTLGKIAQALNITVPPGSDAVHMKALILEYVYPYVFTKTSDADKSAALDDLATKLKTFVTF
jgi:hypothetical protein